MILGLLSDTHDHVEPLKLAIKLLQDKGAQFFIHCGDVGGEEILDTLAGLQCAFVWGNNDWERETLGNYAHNLHLQVCNTFGQIPFDDKLVAITHGDDMSIVQSVMKEEKFDYLFTGHTHVPHDHRYGKLRWINPGALHRAKPKTCATLDLKTDVLKLMELPVG